MAKVRHLVARLIRRCSSVSGGGLSYTSRDIIANSLLAHDYLSRIMQTASWLTNNSPISHEMMANSWLA